MNKEEHKARHKLLHSEFDELIADFIFHNKTGEHLPSKVSVMRLMEWSHEQTANPTEEEK